MKKLIFILIMTLCLSFTACDGPNTVINKISYRIDTVKIDNHDYLVARKVNGISIIHSESCPCNKNKKAE